MTFLHAGLAAAAVAAVSIPILIHLLMRRRRRPIRWGAMRFLLEAYRRQRRRLIIEKWLLLAARCLVVLLAGLAIARPLLAGSGAGGGGRTVYLLIDNSLASQAVGPDGRTALQRHRAVAARVLGGLAGGSGGAAGGDRVALIAMGGPAQAVVLPPSAEVAGAARALESIEATDSAADVQGAMALAASAIETESARGRVGQSAPASRRDTFVILLSDYLEGSVHLSGPLAGSVGRAPSAPGGGGEGGAGGGGLPRLATGVRLVSTLPAESPGDNVAVTGIDPLRTVLMSGAAGGDNVRVTLRRSGPGVARESLVTVRLRLDQVGATGAGGGGAGASAGRPATVAVRFAPGQEEAAASVQVPGTQRDGVAAQAGAPSPAAVLVARIEPLAPGADAIAADGTARRPVEVRETLRVGIVSPRRFGERARVDLLDSSEWVRLALRPGEGPGADSGIELVDVEPAGVDAARLAGLDAVVLARPDLLTPDAWRRVGAFARAGGLVVVMPPGGEAGSGVQLWSDRMVAELGLPWALAREARSAPSPDGWTIAVGPALGDSAAAEASGDLLGLVRAEATELASPVRVFRVLPIDAGAAPAADAGGERVLVLGDATPLVWAGEAGDPGATAFPRTAAESASPIPAAGRGLVVYFAAALELAWTDLPARPLMVPLLQEIIRQGVGRARGSWWTVAGRAAPAPSRAMELVPIETTEGDRPAVGPGVSPAMDRLAVDGVTGFTVEPIRRAGLWRAVDERGAVRGVVAVNPDWRAGRVVPQARADVEAWLRSATDGPVEWIGGTTETPTGAAADGTDALAAAIAGLFSAGRQGPPISVPLLLAALAVALAEMWIARWASHAEAASATPVRAGAPREAAAA
jgi:hypothetical protein